MWLFETTSVIMVITLTSPGSSVVFGCSYDYPADQTVTNTFWKFRTPKDDTNVFEAQEYRDRVEYLGNENHNCTLRMNNLISSDANSYFFRFKTTNNAWSSKTSVSLTLTGLTAEVNPATVREGEKVTLKCSTTCTLSDPPTIVWFRDGQSVSKTEFQTNSEDSGRYRCAVHGQYNLSSAPVSLDVQYAPKNVTLSVRPSGDVTKGNSVTLNCSCSANPPVLDYLLYKEGGQGFTTVAGRQTHTFSNIQPGDSGWYYCNASNSINTVRSNLTTLNVQYPPEDTSVSVSPSGPVVEGSFVNLTCSSHANPAVSYTWYRVNGKSPIQSGTQLILEKVSPDNSGRYYCKAQNKHGALNSSLLFLDVLYPPRNTLVSISLSVPLLEGSSVNLTCSSHANPAVENYTWFKKDGTDASQTGSGDVLALTSLTSSDSGQYFCEARNREGAHKSTVVSLTIQSTNHATNTLIAVYIGSAATVFTVIVLLVFLWMWKIPFKLCQRTAVDIEDDQNSVLSRKRTSNDPATQETRTEEQENALYANVQLPPSHTHHQDSSLYSVVEPPALQSPPEPHYATFDFQQFRSSINEAQFSRCHKEDDVVYSTVKAIKANMTDNLQYASIHFPLPSPTARLEESLEVDHSVIYSTVAKPEA
ncbi:B-cell receptor CD22-like isoform X2 [Oncorhynchus keta]|uniref:B-cell receptor CD22-like isoform X2 n=1 Tax=Oncorhynchus keta TaxID=8018 RepID=UPI0015FB5EDA|nr:B-cell receptor CD22-like isoform X2 [Oncorhynchus keta]XP_035602178.1 B-cell receptor CD22-like isoform X2 [Oncorhynchus keta]